ncbi:MAG: hypothetical protein COA57_09955 [Flavobacteriales bacterium]|nr:hypothetical protein [Flavobacteriales bacterium]MBN4061854.1 hypothetical protein [Bacteroidales bacterium AH-315-I05]PCJ84045.1 MAG: hypothetical protein COA57_09955 [Flavobacteriales bacterium]
MKVNPQDLFVRKYNELRFLKREMGKYETLKAGAILRHLLIDGSPLLHLANKKFSLKAKFEVDNTLLPNIAPNARILFVGTKIGKLKLQYSISLRTLKIGQFLKLELLKIENQKFTVVEIIKYAANKKGGVHFGNKDSSEDELEKLLAKVDYPVLQHSVFEISNIVLIALNPLKEAIIELPKNLPYLAHYNIGPDSSMHFKGKNQYMKTDNINDEIKNGFGALLEVRIMPQKKEGKRFIYEIGGRDNSFFNYSITLSGEGDLISKCKINGSAIVHTMYKNFLWHNNSKWICIGSFINLENGVATMSLFCDNNLVDEQQGRFKKINTAIERHVIAANLAGRQNASLKLIEAVFLKGGIDNQQRTALLDYMEGNWKR